MCRIAGNYYEVNTCLFEFQRGIKHIWNRVGSVAVEGGSAVGDLRMAVDNDPYMFLVAFGWGAGNDFLVQIDRCCRAHAPDNSYNHFVIHCSLCMF
jgi:hypothetical protein